MFTIDILRVFLVKRLKDEVLASKMGVQIKELAKTAQPLIEARLLTVFVSFSLTRSEMNWRNRYRRNEVKEGSIKATSKAWYYIDLSTFIDVTKWRIFKLRKTIDDRLRDVRTIITLSHLNSTDDLVHRKSNRKDTIAHCVKLPILHSTSSTLP